MRPSRKPRSFYRFILPDINENSLRIPNKFTRGHRKQILLSDVVILVSDGNAWFLDWMISDGKLFLQKGWPEFVKHYHLKPGYLLLFDHLGHSIFGVRIFDPSCCEINHPSPIKLPKLETEIDQPVIQDDGRKAMAETEILHPPCPSISKETIVNTDLASERGKEHSKLKSAKNFKSSNPFYSVTMTLSYSQTWGLYVPVGFLRRYLLRNDEKFANCVLVMSDGGNWGPIKCKDYKSYGKLYGGNWQKFRVDTHLGVGDICYIELINEIDNVLKVTIFRAC